MTTSENSKITFLMVRVETDKDIEQIIGHIETIENKISALTRLDVVDSSTISLKKEAGSGAPVFYWP